MEIDKIRSIAEAVMLENITPESIVSRQGICDAVLKAIAAAFEEYERQKSYSFASSVLFAERALF